MGNRKFNLRGVISKIRAKWGDTADPNSALCIHVFSESDYKKVPKIVPNIHKVAS